MLSPAAAPISTRRPAAIPKILTPIVMCIAAPGRRPAFAGPLPAVFRQRHYPPGLLKSRDVGELGRYSRHGRGVTEGPPLRTCEGGRHRGRVRVRLAVDL